MCYNVEVVGEQSGGGAADCGLFTQSPLLVEGALGNRLAVGRVTLDHVGQVRILVPQP